MGEADQSADSIQSDKKGDGKCIRKCELIAYEDLGAEALRKLYVEEMPLVVIIDSEGRNLYQEGRAAYLAGR